MVQLIPTLSQHTEGFWVPVFFSEKNITELNRRLSIFMIPFPGLTTETLTTHPTLL